MKAFIINIEKLFRLDKKAFDDKKYLCIPLYQREYRWTNEKIYTMLTDIFKSNKYLGNIILDERDDHYEIVDGQQRLTTLYLLLICIYNHYSGNSLEQKSISKYIYNGNSKCILINDTVGEYISKTDNLISVQIEDDNDVYFQKNDFLRAYNTINQYLIKLENLENIKSLKNKLINCELLVLINETDDSTHSVEQIFLDINEKSQHLEVEDIFKGHCFEVFSSEFYQQLRDKWTKIKKCSAIFQQFGYKDTSDYIYLYLLENININMPSDLVVDGKHYLSDKTMDDINTLISDMISYGESIEAFYDNVNRSDYRFVDICKNAEKYKTTNYHELLKIMYNQMITYNNAIYQKLPLFFFINYLFQNEDIIASISFNDFRKITTNLYVYSALFVCSKGRKSKKIIDETIKNALTGGNDRIKNTVNAVQNLRAYYVDDFSLKPKGMAAEMLMFIYSVTDFYTSKDNWINNIYLTENNYTIEHFIFPKIKSKRVYWKSEGNSFPIELPSSLNSSKNRTINLLIMEKDLNNSIDRDDIVCKIEAIEDWYSARKTSVPIHIKSRIDYIKSMDDYKALVDMKNGEYEEDEIKEKYLKFVDSYFSSEIEDEIINHIVQDFRNSFI